jgi:diaminopimelate epimerase
VALRFSKYEGLGNDFLVVEQGAGPAIEPALAARLCDRHFGVGGDGVLLTGVDARGPFMKVLNADGSIPEMCGNGLRCVALYLVQRGLVKERVFTVATDAGPHQVEVTPRGSSSWQQGGDVQVMMRPASLDSAEVLKDGKGPFIEQPFAVNGHSVKLTTVSMGNPHAVTFDALPAPPSELGPRIAKDPRFKASANIGFAKMHGPTHLDLTVWERGVGFTLACGTGACAAAVAAVETGRAERDRAITVHLPGGPLTIRVGAAGAPLAMTGPAHHVFDGETKLEGR